MIYRRHYLQFNDLVFGEYDLIDENDYDVSFKSSTTEYGGRRHGSYMPMKGGLVLKEGRVALALTFEMKRLPCDAREHYIDFIKQQINVPGKLWAVENNTLIWAYAQLDGYSPSVRSRRDTLSAVLDFTIPEGVWHKADKLKTFVLPYNPCDFMYCFKYEDTDPCKNFGVCCECEEEVQDGLKTNCCDCECDNVSPELALCYFNDYQGLYKCHMEYKFVYDCESAERFFNDKVGNIFIGQKMSSRNGVISGKLYANTDVDTSDITIKLHGQLHDPYIEINGNGNVIKGDYNGTLIIRPDGSVYAGSSDCDACSLVEVENWYIPEGNEYGWVIHPGYNKVKVMNNSCCGAITAYFDIGLLTY